MDGWVAGNNGCAWHGWKWWLSVEPFDHVVLLSWFTNVVVWWPRWRLTDWLDQRPFPIQVLHSKEWSHGNWGKCNKAEPNGYYDLYIHLTWCRWIMGAMLPVFSWVSRVMERMGNFVYFSKWYTISCPVRLLWSDDTQSSQKTKAVIAKRVRKWNN